MNDGGWMSGARNWLSTRATFKKAEAGVPLLYRDDEDATLSHSWRTFAVSFAIHLVETLAIFALVIGVILLLIWLFD